LKSAIDAPDHLVHRAEPSRHVLADFRGEDRKKFTTYSAGRRSACELGLGAMPTGKC